MTFFELNIMQRSLHLLVLTAAIVGCKSAKSPRSTAHIGTEARFSWEKDAPAAAADNSRPTVLSVRPEFALIELGGIEKRDPGVRLQLTKDGKSFVVEIIKGDDRSTVVSILAGQSTVPVVRAGDELGLAVLAQ
jgi:hypothetical protein